MIGVRVALKTRIDSLFPSVLGTFCERICEGTREPIPAIALPSNRRSRRHYGIHYISPDIEFAQVRYAAGTRISKADGELLEARFW
jgi:hypothetical protein